MERKQLEAIAKEICTIFDVYAAPVPIEIMLSKPVNDIWEELDPMNLSGGFLDIKDRYSPRMSLTRLLVRHVAASDWGKARNLNSILGDTETLNSFAHMVLMPEDMVMGLTTSARNPKTMSVHFEVPEEDARQRLVDLL